MTDKIKAIEEEIKQRAAAFVTSDNVLADVLGMLMREVAAVSPASRHVLAAGLTAISQALPEDDRAAGRAIIARIEASAGMA